MDFSKMESSKLLFCELPEVEQTIKQEKKQFTPRGLRVFLEQDGIKVQESRRNRDYCWIFQRNNQLEVDIDQARLMKEALDEFIKMQEEK